MFLLGFNISIILSYSTIVLYLIFHCVFPMKDFEIIIIIMLLFYHI